MKINIVTVDSGWILQKIAERTAAANKDPNVTFTVSHTPATDADANFYCDLQNCYWGSKTKLDIAYFTHADLNSEQWLTDLLNSRNAFKNVDGFVSMNRRYTEMLEKVGVPSNKLTTITPGETHETFPLKRVKIGVVSRGGYEGYGQSFIENLLEKYHFSNYDLLFLGNGWKNIESIAARKNISLKVINDNDYSFYPKFYKFIDYLLIPGMWTAGPMSMQEALSTGIPIVAADVGFVNYEFQADHVFEPGNVGQAIEIFESIQKPILKRRQQVEAMRWHKYASDIVAFIKTIKEANAQ